MTNFFILASVICIICIFAGSLSHKIGVPSLLLFIVLGMIFGTDGLFHIPFSDFHLSEQVCSTALVFIMFYGGFCTNWKAAKPVAKKAVLLSSAGVLATAVFTGLFCFLALKTSFLEGMLIGSVLASTDAASVFSILRVKKLNLVGGLASMLEVESGSNDPMAYMLTTIVLGLMAGSGASAVPLLFLAQVGFGLLFGFVFGLLSIWCLRALNMMGSDLLPILMMALALLTYGLSSAAGGNGFLSVYIAGIILGNSSLQHKPELVHFFDGITGMMQIILFFLLGLLSFPSQIPTVFFPALSIALFLLVVARPLAVFLILAPFRVPLRQQLMVSWAGLRGAASIVFAIYAVVSPSSQNLDIFHIVFCICLLSVALQGTLLPWAAKKLDVIGVTDNVLKTFNDYQQDRTIHLTELNLPNNHPWAGKKLKDIPLPDGMLAVMIRRDGQALIPKGDTLILPSDTVIFNSPAYEDQSGLMLREVEIGAYHPWTGKEIRSLKLPEGVLIILVKRGRETLIPSGDTEICNGDVLILNA